MIRPGLSTILSVQKERREMLEKELAESEKLVKQIRFEVGEKEKELKRVCAEMEISPSDVETDSDMEECHDEFFIGSLCLKSLPHYQIAKWIGDEKSQWDCIYRASKDGYAPKDFHRCCDNKGPTLCLVKSAGGFVFGGYTPLNWTNNKGAQFDSATFVFSMKNPYNVPPLKFPKVLVGNKRSVYHASSYGMWFGQNDIIIFSGCNNNTSSYTTLGVAFDYNVPFVGDKKKPQNVIPEKFFCGNKNFKVAEMETYIKKK